MISLADLDTVATVAIVSALLLAAGVAGWTGRGRR